MARLSGTGRLADDLYLMAHHDVTGRPHLQPRATGIGLAGALLAELTLAAGSDSPRTGRLRDQPAWRRLTGCRSDPGPGRRRARAAARRGVAAVPGPHRDRARGPAAGRGRVPDRGPARLPWRAGRWVPADSDCAFMPLTRARSALDSSRPPTVHTAALAGLAAACGLETRLLAYAPPRGPRSPQEAAALLPPAARADRPGPGRGRQRCPRPARVTPSPRQVQELMMPRRPAAHTAAAHQAGPARYRGPWPATGSASRPCCSSSWPGSRR